MFGIAESDGGLALHGIEDVSEDESILRILGALQYNIEPKLSPPPHKLVIMPDGKRVLVVRIARSWRGPHFFKNGDNYRMYGRHSKGRFPMDASEMRQAIMASEELPERIRRWRLERIARILAHETPAPLDDGPLLILHVVPHDSFQDEYRFSAGELKSDALAGGMTVAALVGQVHRINMDGLALVDPKGRSCCQLFRSGRIEYVRSLESFGNTDIPSVYYEKLTLSVAGCLHDTLGRAGVRGPMVVLLGLANTKGRKLTAAPQRGLDPSPIDRDQLIMPDVVLEGPDVDFYRVLRPVFDLVWNACGLERSYNYDEQGKWTAGPVEGLPDP